MVKEYFSIENFGVQISDKILESKEITRAKHILQSTIVKKGNRYESGLLWKYDQVELPNNYPMALKRINCLENKMKSNPALAENLRKQIQEFVEKEYISK